MYRNTLPKGNYSNLFHYLAWRMNINNGVTFHNYFYTLSELILINEEKTMHLTHISGIIIGDLKKDFQYNPISFTGEIK